MTLVSRDLLIIEQQGADAAAAFSPTDVQHSHSVKYKKRERKGKGGGGGTDTNKPECNASTRHIVFEQDAQSWRTATFMNQSAEKKKSKNSKGTLKRCNPLPSNVEG